MRNALATCLFVLALAGCSTASVSPPTDAGGGTEVDGGSDGSRSADAVTNLRGKRYCEVLLATQANDTLHIEVFNTQGLNDCPDDEWKKLDASALKTQFGVTLAILNGPRFWMLDAFVEAALVAPDEVTFGTIAMRKAATIDFPTSQLASQQAPYAHRSIARKTVVRFAAGAPVFELVDPEEHAYVMQSYSVQKEAQSPADLGSLASRLKLPAGWAFRTRTLDSDLVVTAVEGRATVVQDDFANTYQMWK